MCYRYFDLYSSTADITCTVLLKVLKEVYSGQRELWIQLDSAADNRANSIFGLAGYLVRRGIYDVVNVSFLKVLFVCRLPWCT